MREQGYRRGLSGRLGLVGVLAALMALATPQPAAANGEEDSREQDEQHGFMEAPRQLSGTLTGKQFVAGPEVFIDAMTDDDVFAAGGDVELRGAQVRDIFSAGGLVTLEGVTAEDAIVAGGKVELRGTLEGDFIAAGGSVEVGPDSVVGGDVLAAGGRVSLAGEIDGMVRAAGGQIRLDGRIGGDVSLAGERIVLGPNTRIEGNLTYRSPERLKRMEGAVVAGQIERGRYERPEMPDLIDMVAAGAFGWIAVVLAGIALAALLIGTVPRLIAGASDGISLQPWPTLGIGVLLLIAVPIAAPILMATLIGLPIGVLALLLFLVFLSVGLIAVALWIGQHLPRIGGRHAGHIGFGARFGRAVAGVVILALLGLVPFLGGLVLLIALAFGLGAVAVQAWALVGGRD